MQHKYFLKEPIGDMLLSLIIVCGFVIAALLIWIGYICEKTVIFGIAAVTVMRAYSQGDLWFNQEYRDFVICSVIYEKNAIDYLKSINPNMEIMYSND